MTGLDPRDIDGDWLVDLQQVFQLHVAGCQRIVVADGVTGSTVAVLLFEGHSQGPGRTLHQGGIKAVRHDSLQGEQCEGDAVRGISVSLGSAATEMELRIPDAMLLPSSHPGKYFVHG